MRDQQAGGLIAVEQLRTLSEQWWLNKRSLDAHAVHEAGSADQAHVWGVAAEQLDALIAAAVSPQETPQETAEA